MDFVYASEVWGSFEWLSETTPTVQSPIKRILLAAALNGLQIALRIDFSTESRCVITRAVNHIYEENVDYDSGNVSLTRTPHNRQHR